MPIAEAEQRVVEDERSSRSAGMSRAYLPRVLVVARDLLVEPDVAELHPPEPDDCSGCAGRRRCRSRRGACGAPRPTRAAACPVVIQITNRNGNAAAGCTVSARCASARWR